MNTFRFAVLDPRNLPAATAANDAIFASGPVLGIEVTIPALAARCMLGNIDPQHSGQQDADKAAIEAAISAPMPPDGATLVTVRADLDSVGAMAVFETRRFLLEKTGGGCDVPNFFCQSQVQKVATADKFARGSYPGPQPLPTAENTWPAEGSADSTKELAAIAAAVADFKVPLEKRVETMKKWFFCGEENTKELAPYREKVERERQDLIKALADGTIRAKRVEFANGALALVESTHRAATSVGYSLAPVVVALNPSFKLGAGEPHRKFTVCAYEAGKFADIKSALVELDNLERGSNPWYAEEAARQSAKVVEEGKPPVTVEQVKGWGGSPTIGGSPQGVSSTLTVEQVVEVVSRHLK